MSVHFRVPTQGQAVSFHVWPQAAQRDLNSKMHAMQRHFRRIPASQARVICPIFVFERKPGGAQGGGYWKPSEVATNFRSAGHERNTGVPNAYVHQHADPAGLGVIGISMDRWRRAPDLLKFSIFHEIGHCLDHWLGLSAGKTAENYPGMLTNRCGSGNPVARRAVEAYARYMVRGHHIYHQLPPGQSPAAADAALIATLQSTPAFAGVPAS